MSFISPLESFFDYTFEMFQDDYADITPYYIVGIMAIIAGIIAVCIVSLGLNRAFKLYQLNKFLKTAKSREDFALKFGDFRDLIEKKSTGKPFSHIWKEYNETLIEPEHYETKDVIRNTIRPHDFFDYAEIKWTPRTFESWPNIFVGIGLLFTFIGLAAAISAASLAVGSSNVAQTQAALSGVLAAAKVKFLTSIAGLGISILLTIWIKLWGGIIKHQLHEFCDNLEFRMLFAFSESIEQKQLSELEQQSLVLKHFTDNFAMNLGEILEKNLSSSMTVALQPLNDAIKEQLDRSDQRGSEHIENMVAQLGEQLSAGTDSQMQQIVVSLNSVHETLNATASDFSNAFSSGGKNLLEQMNAATQSFANEMRTLGEQMNAQTQEKLADTLGEISNVGRTMNDATDHISTALAKSGEDIVLQLAEAGKAFSGEIVDTVGNMSRSVSQFDTCVSTMDERLRAHANLLDERIDNVAKTMPTITDAIRTLTSASDPIKQAMGRVEELASSLKDATSNIDETRTALKETSQRILEAQEITRDAWKDYQERFEGVDQALANVFEEYVKQLNHSQESIQEFMLKTDDNFNKAGTGLQHAVSELTDALEDIPNKI